MATGIHKFGEDLFCQDLPEFLQAQYEEVQKYKWYLGERLHRDPLQDRTFDEIYQEWYATYGKEYRKEWYESRGYLDPEEVTAILNRDLPEFLHAQIEEVFKYIWYKGVELGRDPRVVHPVNYWFSEWITRYGSAYRKRWYRAHQELVKRREMVKKPAEKKLGC